MEKHIMEVNKIIEKYNLSQNDKMNLWDIIYPIFIHDEFQKRMNCKEFPHHGTISLGDHIINDAVVTYSLSKKLRNIDIKIDQELSTIIAMFHDLYELPWQNSGRKPKLFVNWHGFVHPVEASINAVTWYPEYFEDENKANIIIDGIIHHMFPLPVRSINGVDAELNNEEKLCKLDTNIQELIIGSSMKCNIKNISICPSSFIEGNVVSVADKISSLTKGSFNDYKALMTGKNPDLDNYQKKK